jgi:hypothetical protein
MKKLVSFLCAVIVILPIQVFAVSDNSSANSNSIIAQLQEQIKALQTQIAELTAKLTTTQTEVATIKEELRLTKTLKLGMTDAEVSKLQSFLKTMPDVYPEGLVTGYYGQLTAKAVKKFQEKNAGDVLKPLGLSIGTGVVGEKTMEKMNKVIAESATTVVSGTTNSVAVNEAKITICHFPPGDTENKQTITVGTSALSAHKAHGDTIGACDSEQVHPSPTPAPTVCIMDAKKCSDGSYVTRISPNCEFASCPVSPTSPYYINIISPNGGETWTTGSSQYIKWSSNLPSTQNIMTVRLRDSASREYDIINNIQNDGVELLNIPSTLASGSYRFEIKTAIGSQTVFDQSDGMITLVNPNINTPAKYLISATQGANGTIFPAFASVVSGASQTFTIVPATGYQISGVLIDGANHGAISSYAFTNVQVPHTITATFTAIPQTQSCSLTVSLSPSTPTAQYVSPGQSAVPLVKFNATPNCSGTLNSFAVSLLPMPSGYQNISTLRLYNDTTGVQLSSTQSVSGASVNFASVNTPLIANQPLVLKVVGDVSPSASGGSSVYGVFGGSYGVSNSGGVIGNNASGNIIMGNTMTVSANTVEQHTITVTQGANGTISPSTISIANNGNQTFTITPITGNQTASVIVDGSNQGAISSYTFTNVQAPHTITASFTAIPSNLPAPTELKVGYGIMSGVANWVKISESFNFKYDFASLANVSAFRLYQKKPQDSSYTMVGEFSDPSGLITCSTKRTYGTWTLSSLGGGPTGCPGSSWYLTRTSAYPVSSYAVGDYFYYVSAVNTSGVEGPISLLSFITFLGTFSVQTPITVETAGTLNPTFRWTPAGGSSQPLSYWVIVAPSDGSGSQIMLTPFSSSGPNISKVYDGPALIPGKQYSVWIYGRSHNALQTEDIDSYASEVATFTVSP